MADLMALVNVLLACLIAIFEYHTLRVCRALGLSCWLSIANIIMGMYWGGLYVFVLLSEPGSYDSVWFGQVVVRPAMTLTLGLWAARAISWARIKL